MTAPKIDIYSDAYLTETANSAPLMSGRPNGFARAAGYLLEVPYAVRSEIASEAHLQTNLQGGRYADWVSQLAARHRR